MASKRRRDAPCVVGGLFQSGRSAFIVRMAMVYRAEVPGNAAVTSRWTSATPPRAFIGLVVMRLEARRRDDGVIGLETESRPLQLLERQRRGAAVTRRNAVTAN